MDTAQQERIAATRANANREAQIDDAQRRRNLEGNNLFCNLGEPIQKLLMQVHKNISNDELKILSKITVRQLAKVFDMLSLGEDPDKILFWLQREALRAQGKEEAVKTSRKNKIDTGAARDAVAFYKELEKKNMELMEKFKQQQTTREEERKHNIEIRRKRREEAAAQAAADKERAIANGEKTDSIDRLKKADLADIYGAFDRFTAKSVFDNSNNTQDTEWWKQDDFRRDWERNGRKGKLWSRVVEGGSQTCPDSELALREEWYRSQCWWKAEKYRREWLASRDSEWWKEETYIRDWQENGEKGRLWLAADEVSGFNRKGHLRPAAKIELERRQAWYRDNGPKGIVKQWCGASEGSADRCLLEEKHEREDYFKNGDWWKSETLRRKWANDPNTMDSIKSAGAAMQDREWWKEESYRNDFASKGAKWKAASEKAAVLGLPTDCTEAEQQKRADWFTDYWWKADKYIQDYKKNRENGKLWKARSEEDAGTAAPKPCKDVEAKQREDWFQSCDDREWWKDEQFIRDWQENGSNGKKWVGAWQEAALAAKGTEDRAPQEVLAQREEYYKNNWWKQEKYAKDFSANGKKGTVWKTTAPTTSEDGEWWKDGEFVKKWCATKHANLEPFWKQPMCVEDYWKCGAEGKKWTAANAAAASVDKGDTLQATPEEMAEREAFYTTNWWKTEECRRDYAVNGTSGHLWTAQEPGGKGRVSTAELKQREAFFNPKWKAVAVSPQMAMLEADARTKPTAERAPPEEVHRREAFFKKNWWKAPEVREDYQLFGENSKMLHAATPEIAASGVSEPQCTAEEFEERKAYFDNPTTPEEWWQDEVFIKDYRASEDADFWRNPECIEDFLTNARQGTKWCAKNAAVASTEGGRTDPAPEEELQRRENWLKENFWKAPQYQQDFEQNHESGTLWTTTEPDGKGTSASEGELKVREEYFRKTFGWQLAEKPETKEWKCAPVEAIDREEWYENNWWKSPDVQKDYEEHGQESKLLRAATWQVVNDGLAGDPQFEATPEQIAERAQYFETHKDSEWWKSPGVVEDYVKYGKEGAVWQSRSLPDSRMSLGLQDPAHEEELQARTQWFEANYWKTPTAIEDYMKNGNKGAVWTSKRGEGEEGGEAARVPEEEVTMREQWMEVHRFVPEEELATRRDWLQQQLTDEEKVMRRQWIQKKTEEAKRIHTDELADALAALNDGEKPSPEQLKAIEEVVRRRRLEAMGVDHDPDSITQEEFVTAVADTNFYVPATEEERRRAEEEALEALQQEEMARLEEEAAFLAMEAEEERAKAGEEGKTQPETENAAAPANEEEAAFLEQLDTEEAEKAGAHANEDDVQMSPEEETAYQEWLSKKPEEEAPQLSAEEQAQLAAAEEERKAAEAAGSDPNQQWASEELEGEPAVDPAENKEDLKQLVQDDGNHWDDEEQEEVIEEVIDEMQMEEKGQPVQWKLPLPEVTNPQFLKQYFTVVKYTPGHSLFGGKQKRVWVVDHFTRCFYNLDVSGKILKEHTANKLLQLERNTIDTTRLRMMFFDAAHSYEIEFQSSNERERFYETASAIRPSIRVYAPDLTNPDTSVEACTTTIDGVGANSVSVTCAGPTGKPVVRELTGECKINASKLLTEPLTIWCGTFNLSGHPPPRDPRLLSEWMPQDKYDIYAVAVQEASFRRDESEWFEMVQKHLGKEYLTLASMNLWDTLLIVLSRKKHLLKITNVEGSTKATIHKSVCGTKGGIGISLRFLETSLCFVTCHLAARLERVAMRNTNLEEVVDCLQMGLRETDFCNQFNHVFVFGDLNYRVEMDTEQADKAIKAGHFEELLLCDQLTQQRRDEGILHGFQEPPITFAPTYRMQIGNPRYLAEKGNAPSYCDRVITRSMANTWIKCTSYKSVPSVMTSEHIPVSSTFIVRCVRPVMSCFMKQQSPIPLFVIEEVNFAESSGPIIKKPLLSIVTPFTGSVKPVECKTQQTATPSWGLQELPRMESTTQALEFLETCHIILIVREGAEKRDDKSHRGTGLITLYNRVVGLQDTQQAFESDVMSHGKCIGKMIGRFHWEPAVLR